MGSQPSGLGTAVMGAGGQGRKQPGGPGQGLSLMFPGHWGLSGALWFCSLWKGVTKVSFVGSILSPYQRGTPNVSPLLREANRSCLALGCYRPCLGAWQL